MDRYQLMQLDADRYHEFCGLELDLSLELYRTLNQSCVGRPFLVLFLWLKVEDGLKRYRRLKALSEMSSLDSFAQFREGGRQ